MRRAALVVVEPGLERIHGNRSQAKRTQTVAGFKDDRIRVLVVTDISAPGGIDIMAPLPTLHAPKARCP
jgi:hypothetical protein